MVHCCNTYWSIDLVHTTAAGKLVQQLFYSVIIPITNMKGKVYGKNSSFRYKLLEHQMKIDRVKPAWKHQHLLPVILSSNQRQTAENRRNVGLYIPKVVCCCFLIKVDFSLIGVCVEHSYSSEAVKTSFSNYSQTK